MGEPIRLVISVDEETQRILDRWQEQFFPLVGRNRSRLVRLVVQTLDRLGFTAETLTAALSQNPRLNAANLEQSVTTLNNLSQHGLPVIETGLTKKPLRRAQDLQGKQGASRREVISRRSYAEVRWAYNLPSLSNLRSIKYSRRAA